MKSGRRFECRTGDVDARLTADGALREPWLAAREARGPGRPRRRPEAAAETLAAARAFARLDALRKLVASVVAARLGAAELEPVRLDFADFDADGDGELSLSEFYGALGGEGAVPVEEAAALFDAADVAGDGGAVALREFAAIHACGRLAPTEAQLFDAFDVLDDQGAGLLGADDLRGAVGAGRCVGADDEDVAAALDHHRAGDDDDALLDWPQFRAACAPLLRGGAAAP